MKNLFTFVLLFFVFLYLSSCSTNSEADLISDLKVENRTGGSCAPNSCIPCRQVSLSITYPGDDCYPVIELNATNHGFGSCPGSLSIDWGDGMGYQSIGTCFNMGCPNLPTITKSYLSSIPFGSCADFVVYWKYSYDSMCSTCFGGQANTSCNPLIVCKVVRVCNSDGKNCIAD